jgi:dTDP-4-dehydrorhamnose reductase
MISTEQIELLKGKRILLVGAGGQLGQSMKEQLPTGVEMLALDRKKLNIVDTQAVKEAVTKYKPHWLINAAAYTAVDKAESEAEIAFSINRDGAANLANAAKTVGARMVQVSTDYVFDGAQARPYKPDDSVNPINVYGESKLAGEVATREILGDDALILRTAWVYAANGRNFVKTMLRLINEREEVRVVEDQVGTPTSATTLADAVILGIALGVTGTHHWTNTGVASWYDFAVAIQATSREMGITEGNCRITPIPTSEYPTPAKRPACTLLDKSSFRQQIGNNGVHWVQDLGMTIGKIAKFQKGGMVNSRVPV